MLILILPWSKCQKPCMRRPHCRPKAARSRLTPTLLNPYRFRKVMRKPKPMKIMTWTSWNTAERRGEVSCAADFTLLRSPNCCDLTASDSVYIGPGDECPAFPFLLRIYDLETFSYYHHGAHMVFIQSLWEGVFTTFWFVSFSQTNERHMRWHFTLFWGSDGLWYIPLRKLHSCVPKVFSD